ncbi:MAG TPA: AAA family ATPase [Pirellulales bacterium]|nr:AAA family ATPase [Pirellulales bacterium]
MKIDRLDLRAFGPFTGVTLDLDGGDFGLHIVYGPNEAGKSSSLRAVRQLFYGVPTRSIDSFVHAYPDLRIGATLTRAGERLDFVRRKAAKNDLRAADDVTPLEPGALDKYLGGLDRESFETMFGIDHPALVEGGRELVRGGGSLGEILFAAGSGIADLRAVQQRLDAEAAALFVPRGSNPSINRNLAEWDKARKAARAAELPPSEWEQHDKALRQARQKRAELDDKLSAAVLEKLRLERARQAVPLAAKRKQLLDELSPLGAVVPLDDRFSQRRRDAVAVVSANQDLLRAAQEAIQELDAQIAQLHLPESLLAPGDAIDRLQNDLGGYRKAQHDRPLLAGQRDQFIADAREILAQLRGDLTLAEVDTLRLTKKRQIELQNLANRHGALATQAEQAQRSFEERHARLQAARAELAALETPRDPRALQAALRRAQSLGAVEEQRTAAELELARLETQAANELARLGLWTGELAALERLSLPAAQTIDRYEQDLSAAESALARVAERREVCEADLAALDRQLAQLQLQGDVPSEENLAESRRRRDAGWRLVRDAWIERTQDSSERREFVAGFAPAPDLAAAYETAVRQTDELADRLRREADRVASGAGLLASQQSCRAEIENLAGRQRMCQELRQRLLDEWNALWQPLGVAPLTPREMRPWTVKQQSLALQAEAVRKQRTLAETLKERTAASVAELDRACLQLDERPAAEGECLPSMIERAQLLVERHRLLAERRAALESELAILARELDEKRAHAENARHELAEWRQCWSAAVEPLGLPADATPAQANEALALLQTLFEKLSQAASYAGRIDDIGRDAVRFVAETAALVAQFDPQLAGLPAEEAAGRLIEGHRRAIAQQGRLDALRKQREKLALQIDQAEKAIREAEGALKALCQEAQCDAPQQLPEFERRAAAAKALRQELGHLNEKLLLLGAPATVEDFIAQVGNVDPDELPARIDTLERQIATWEEERKQAADVIAVEGRLLADMDTSATAADAAERAAGLLAEIGSDVEEYVRLRLASAVLRTAVERYRAKNQGPVVERASSLFAELTAGSFAALRADYDDAGAGVLVGVRPDGRTVGVEAMSDGTADQLYLALRLASLENYLAEKEPLPFIVDDILIRFDDERSTATLKVLAQLSQRTQVIFFTHHEHLVDLAERHVEGGRLYVHRLG